MATSGSLPAGASLAGIGITLTLPAGVTPALDASGQVDTSRLVNPSGVTIARGLAVTAVYLEATAGKPAHLCLVAAGKAAAGFGVGETMLITLNRTADVFPKASDFAMSEFSAADTDGKAVSGLQMAVTAVKLE